MTPATELRTAALALHDPDIDACQEPGCGCPEELHRRDADGLSWCTDCQEQHSYRPAPASDIPERLRGPLADLLTNAAEDFEMCERMNSRDPYNDGKTRIMPHRLAGSALAVARALLGEVTQ